MTSGDLVVGESHFESLKGYVGFTEESSLALQRLHPLAAPHLPGVVEDLHPAALREALRGWLERILAGPHDESHFRACARVGEALLRLELPQAFVLVAMNRVRVRLTEVAQPLLGEDVRRFTMIALDQIIDMDLAITFETYREDLMAKHRRADRLAIMGQFAAGVGHELRSPLGVIESSAYLVRRRLEEMHGLDGERARPLDDIVAAVKRASRTIADLLDLAGARPPKRRLVAVASLLDEARRLAPLSGGVNVRADIPEETTIDGDPEQLAAALANLLLNASQAMNGEGSIWLQARRRGHCTDLRVWDEGPGVPTELRHRIFEPLVTTKKDGSGFGLALCRRVAEGHGGTLVLEPTVQGASFLLTVPDAQNMHLG